MDTTLIEVIKNHKSIRRFTDRQIDDSLLDEILDAARHASSHHNTQAYSIIKIHDKRKKEVLSKIAANQEWVIDCPVFIVVCMDFYRINQACNYYGETMQIDELESIMIGSVEGGLVGQNIMLMAESQGLGGVIIGGIRNKPTEVIELLDLPKYTFPLFGICLGYPDPKQIPWLKPRLPKEIAIFDERYNKESIDEGLKNYEEVTSDYYNRRTMGENMDGWSKRMSEYISNERRPFLKEKLIEQGFLCK